MEQNEITVASLFIAQSAATLGEADSEYQFGSADDIIAWANEHTTAATKRQAQHNVPEHTAVEFNDRSTIVIVQISNKVMRLANLKDVVAEADWHGNEPTWVQVNGQQKAKEYIELVDHLLKSVQYPSEIIAYPRKYGYNTWANMMLDAGQGKAGNFAEHDAQKLWTAMHPRRDEETL